MIRIDLKTDELSKAPKKEHAFLRVFKTQLKGQAQRQVSTNYMLMLGIAALIAYLPNFVFDRYKTTVLNRYANQITSLNQNLQSLDIEIQKMNAYQLELASFEKQKEDSQKRLQVVQKLISRRSTPVSVLDVIGQKLPQRTWLKTIRYDTGENKDTAVLIEGQSFSNSEISDYVDRLNESVYLKDVRLENVRVAQKEKEVDTKEFSIVASLPGVTRQVSSQDKNVKN